MRIRTLSFPQKSLLTAVSIAASLGVIAVPASAATGPAPTAAESTQISTPVLRPVDQDAAYFTSVAQSTAELAEGKVDTATLDVQIALVQQSKTMPAASVDAMTDQLRSATATVAAQLVSYDKEQAKIKAAKIKAAKIKAAKEKAAREEAAKKAAKEAAARAERQRTSSSSSAPAPASAGGGGDNSPSAARAYARSLMASQYGWGGDQFQCLNSLWNRESGWNYHAYNPSGAYGIPQALPGSKMGAGWQNSARVQVAWGLGYIKARYGTPCGAWGHSQSTGWY